MHALKLDHRILRYSNILGLFHAILLYSMLSYFVMMCCACVVCMAGNSTDQSSRNPIAQRPTWIRKAVRDFRGPESFGPHKYIRPNLGGRLLVLHVVEISNLNGQHPPLSASEVCKTFLKKSTKPSWPKHIDYTNDSWSDAKLLGFVLEWCGVWHW